MRPEFTQSAEALSDIRACYEAYRQALLDQRGEDAAGLVTVNTREHYAFYQQAALHAPAEFVLRLSAIDGITVLRIRHGVPLELLQHMTGADVFAHSVNLGWIGRDSVTHNEIGEIVVCGDWAEAECITSGGRTPMRFRFEREQGAWKLDLLMTLHQTAPVFENIVSSEDMSRGEALMSFLCQVVDEDLDDTLLDPLVD